MKIDDDNIIAIQLKARDVYERALVAGKTSPRDDTYADRMEWVREALVELLKVIEVKP
jgi:hypothetical protein